MAWMKFLGFGPVCKWEKAFPVIYEFCATVCSLVISPLPRVCLTAIDTQLSSTCPSPHLQTSRILLTYERDYWLPEIQVFFVPYSAVLIKFKYFLLTPTLFSIETKLLYFFQEHISSCYTSLLNFFHSFNLRKVTLGLLLLKWVRRTLNFSLVFKILIIFILLGSTEEVHRSLASNPYVSSSVSFRMDFSWVKQSWHSTLFFPHVLFVP